MTSTGVIDIEGNGEYLLPAGVLITALEWWVDDTPVRVEYLSENKPARLLRVGWIATGSGIEDTPFDELTLQENPITWFSFFEFESNLRANPSGFPYDDRIVWGLTPGVTAHFEAFW
jgi:hypothetical protein